MPVDISFVDIDHRPVYREMYRDLTQRLMLLGKQNSRILVQLTDPGNAHTTPFVWDPVQVRGLYNAWLKTMVENAPTLNEVKRYTQALENDEEEIMRFTMNASIFAELSRMHFILHWDTLQTEHTQLLSMSDVPTRDEQKRFLCMWSLSLTESQLWTDIPLPEDLDWDTPVLKYSQCEVMAATSLLCEIMGDLGSISKSTIQCPFQEGTREFMEYFRALFTRNAVFMCQSSCVASILNVPEMRNIIGETNARGQPLDKEGAEESSSSEEGEERSAEDVDPTTQCTPSYSYFVWCSFYFGAIMRRIYYWENLKKNLIRPKIFMVDGELQRCQDAIALIAEQLGEDAFEDIYADTCDEAYAIPGDSEWFAYRYPAKQPAMGNILYGIRPELRARYWKEAHVTLETVLAASRQPQPRYFMRTSQIFVINVLDAYLRTTNVMWRNAAVVSQEGIELSVWKLSRPTCPVLLQVFSRWWVYHDLFYQPCDDIYEALVVWFRILRTHYNDVLFGTSLKDISDRILL